ncbi:Spo11/DNA topoisomerase VI subunit A [Tricharina praecox]|uniref:Spo11/DNA topoisomerase VI subunit A n=1 Tax=Tricharina praecox TaxID=43433 RepID=UPI002220AD7B|nr:Spo11/DNA topoisomerase VI subunit A [Tricharina praecox]KAI5844185.1 Spo11/DNA topoisomerase VI subunit A [Tricharina praecox]
MSTTPPASPSALAPATTARAALISRIHALLTSMHTDLSLNRPLTLTILSRTTTPPTPTTLTFPGRTPTHSHRFTVYALLLRTLHTHLTSTPSTSPPTTTTKRDIFYRHPAVFRSQAVVDRALDDLAATLGVRRQELGVVAGAKGLVCGGGLVLHTAGGGGHSVLCEAPTLIPSAAAVAPPQQKGGRGGGWVLYIEKESIFHRLSFTPLRTAGVLVTGKGYADIATRELLSLLATQGRRVYALVDLDPYGIEIMLTVAEGSRALAHEGPALTVGVGVGGGGWGWLGVRWGDVKGEEGWVSMGLRDRGKAQQLLGRARGDVRTALQRMLFVGVKAEIEILGEGLGKWVAGRIEEEEEGRGGEETAEEGEVVVEEGVVDMRSE